MEASRVGIGRDFVHSLIAYHVNRVNLPIITVNNGGVEPTLEGESRWFVIGGSKNVLVGEQEFFAKYRIVKAIHREEGRYSVARR